MDQPSETRSQVIVRAMQRYLHDTGASMPTLATAIVEAYHRLTPLHLRRVLFHEGGDAYDDARANAQLVRRMMDQETRLPVDMEEAIREALPEPFKSHLRAELAERVGLLAAEIPSGGQGGRIYDAGRLMSQQGEALQALAPLLGDGHLGEDDRPHAPEALAKIDAALAQLESVRHGLVALIGDGAEVTQLAEARR